MNQLLLFFEVVLFMIFCHHYVPMSLFFFSTVSRSNFLTLFRRHFKHIPEDMRFCITSVKTSMQLTLDYRRILLMTRGLIECFHSGRNRMFLSDQFGYRKAKQYMIERKLPPFYLKIDCTLTELKMTEIRTIMPAFLTTHAYK